MFRLVTLNLNGIRSAATMGFVRPWAEGVAADCGGCRRSGAGRRRGQPLRERGRPCRALPLADKKGLLRRGPVYAQKPSAVITGIGNPEFDAEAATSRRATTTRGASCPSSAATSRAAPAARSASRPVPLGTPVMAPHLVSSRPSASSSWRRRSEHRPLEIDLRTGRATRRTAASCRGARLDEELLDGIGLVDVFRRSTRTPSSTRGGATAARPGRRTWAGGSTTTSPRRRSPPRHRSEHIYLEQRFSDHAPLVIDYDFTL